MTSMRTLVLLRHAKAASTAPSDRERPLTSEGLADAEAAGRWLADRGITADAALVSDAGRTSQTWEQVATGAGWAVTPELSPALYAADPQTATDLIAATDADVSTLVVVGHNPTIAYLAQVLDDGSGDQDAVDAMITGGYPPCTLTVFEVPGEWADLEQGARLVAHHVARA